ncbi:MAG TPA: FtsW/RodA/SpoVE family cell cycle protein [Candidatus Onthousia faecigallinarum]|nr:FtsW/RodA/SpoVE family cell cycle protein [Candidatus Onthousia faecigallinarum]
MLHKKRKIDWGILLPVICFAIISIITISSALTYLSPTVGNLALKQAIWYVIGGVIIFVLFKFKNDYLYRNAWFFYLLCNLLLLFLLLFAPAINNSKCWFVLPGIGSFQPSEFMKVSLILVLAVMIYKFRENHQNPSIKEEFLFLLRSFLVVLVPSILTFLEPDTGAVIIYFVIYFVIIFTSGIRLRWFFIFLLLILLVLGFVLGTYFFQEELFVKIFGTDLYYRFDRIFSWQSGSGLQLENALASIGSAGVFGYGYNQTPIYFPESGTDFIFAVFASNFGLLGAIVLLLLIVFFDGKLIYLASKKINPIDKFTLAGIIGMLVFQQVQNIGMTIGLFPITGITLPFISYGGSSLLSYMILVGIVLNISSEDNRKIRI